MKKILLLVIAILSIIIINSQTSLAQELPSSNLNNIVHVNGTNISVNYDITSGKLISINADTQSKTLIISVQSTGNSNFTLSMPRSLIDARENGDDARFVVLSNNHGVKYQEVERTTDRILTISLPQGTEKIQIIGTQMSTQAPIASGFTQGLGSSSGLVIEAPFSDNTPVIDGKWTTPDEWDKTKAISVEKNDTKMYIIAQHDMNFLYVIADVVTDQSASSYSMLLRYDLLMIFDINNYQGNTLGSNNIGIGTSHTFINGTEVKTRFGSEVWTYDNQSNAVDLSSTSNYNSSAGFSSTNDPFESIHDHRIYEFRIPMSLLHNSDKYGFSLKAAACSSQNISICRPIYTLFWPSASIMSVPSSHGTLKLDNATTTVSSSETIPNNFELILIGIVVGGGGIAGFFYYRNTSKQKMKR